MKKYWQYLISFLFVFLIYGIHMLPVSDSMLNENNTEISHVFLASQIRYHQEFAPFARRPFTSLLIEGTSGIFGITLGESFVIINLLLLFVSGVLVYTLSIILNASQRQALFNQGCYFLTFSILFAFFPPVFSYDEPLQYVLILLSFLSLLHGKWQFYIPLFLMAMITRESTVFLWPGLVLLFSGVCLKGKKVWSAEVRKKIVYLFAPLPLYGVYLVLFLWMTGIWKDTNDIESGRLSCYDQNFGTFASSVESIISFFLVLAPFLYFLFWVNKTTTYTRLEKKYLLAFLLALAINTPIVWVATLARESRLFAIPLFFIWPIAAQLFGKELLLLLKRKLYFECFKKWQNCLLFCCMGLINYFISFKVYVPSFPSKDNFFNEYLFVIFLILSLHFVLARSKKASVK